MTLSQLLIHEGFTTGVMVSAFVSAFAVLMTLACRQANRKETMEAQVRELAERHDLTRREVNGIFRVVLDAVSSHRVGYGLADQSILDCIAISVGLFWFYLVGNADARYVEWRKGS